MEIDDLRAALDAARARAEAAERERDTLREALADVICYAPSGPPWDLFQQRVLKAQTTLAVPTPDGGTQEGD